MLYLEKYNEYSDTDLILEYKRGYDNILVGVLYKRYSHLVLGLCLKYLKNEDDAKDAVMQIFEKLLTDLLKHDIEYFKSWLYVFSKNYCLMLIRKNQRLLAKDIDLQINASSFMETTDDLHLNPEQEKEQHYVID